MKRSPFGEWILIILLACVAIAYWYIALALATGAALSAYAYRQLVDRAGRELDAADELYVSDILNAKSPTSDS